MIPQPDRAGSRLASVCLRALALVAASWATPAVASLPRMDDAHATALERPSAHTPLEQREQERETCGAFCEAGKPKRPTQESWGGLWYWDATTQGFHWIQTSD